MPNNESALTREADQWVINAKFIGLEPARIHTERIELGDCSESDAQEAFEAVNAIMEAEHGTSRD